MSESSDSEHWKTQYRVLVAEQSATNDEWFAVLRFARHALQSMLIGCIGRSDAWDARIETLRTALGRAETSEELKKIADDVDQLTRGMIADPYCDPSTIRKLADQLTTVRDETAAAMQNFSALAGLVDVSRFADVESASPTAISDDVASLSAALVEGFRNLSLRHAEAEQFLDEVRDALVEVAVLADADADSVSDQRTANAALKNDVDEHVAGLQSAVAASDDLSQLRRQVRAGFGAISARMEAFRSAEDARLDNALERNKVLRAELGELREKSDVLHQKIAEQRALLLLDTLTGVHSRFSYEQRLDEEIARVQRNGSSLCYSVWDIDHFKLINDTYGHQVGDAALREVAACLVRHTRTTDFVARIGGEEFVILFPDTELRSAMAVSDKLRDQIAQTSFENIGVDRPLTVSCGVTVQIIGDDADSLYARADGALYQAKNDGRNRCQAA
ncbi:MAG: diguanylate cyclase [Pseudomonadota bacterium]